MQPNRSFFLVGTDPGAKNQLKHFNKYLNTKELNSSFHDLNKSNMDFIDDIKSKDIVIMGTSMNMKRENNFYKKISKKETINYIFLDETYNVKKRLSNVRSFRNIKKILYQEFTPKNEILEFIDHDYVGYLTNDIYEYEDPDIFKYEFDADGPIILIDEFKEKFNFFDGTVIKNNFLSNILPSVKNIKIRQHPKNFNIKSSNYLQGKASGFIGYSSSYLYMPIIRGFKVASVASEHTESSVLNSLNIPRTKVQFNELDENVFKKYLKHVNLMKRNLCQEMLEKLNKNK